MKSVILGVLFGCVLVGGATCLVLDVSPSGIKNSHDAKLVGTENDPAVSPPSTGSVSSQVKEPIQRIGPQQNPSGPKSVAVEVREENRDDTDQGSTPDSSAVASQAPKVMSRAETEALRAPPVTSLSSQVFWASFDARIKAENFAKSLSSRVGIPLSVVRVGPGQYRIAFSFLDESDKEKKIIKLRQVLGGELPLD